MKINGQEIDSVEVLGARVHNLKNIDVEIPHDRLTVITGLSGSGKSSLAFDTVFAEGQRRYLETFSSYARNMLGILERPNVDKISGLCPVISIGQKTVNRNPRSTVGTTTEVYDYLRLLYARAADAYSYLSGERMVKYTTEKILSLILERYQGRRIYVLAPLVKNRKGHYKDLFENLRKKGYINVRIDGTLREITFGMKLDRYVNHSVELVVDRLKVADKDLKRLADTAELAFKQGNGQLMILDGDTGEVGYYSRSLMDPATGLSYLEPAPHNFSFNSPLGACPHCKGLGYVNLIDRDKIIPDMSLSIRGGGILPLGKDKNLNLRTETLSTSNYFLTFDGLVKYIEMQQDDTATSAAQKWAGQFFSRAVCPECGGARLNREALHFKLADKNIAQLVAMDITELRDWIEDLQNHVTPTQWEIAREIVKEISSRLSFLIEVGLDYMSLNRNSASLSGGESQRIRLATQIGSRLVNVLYILDEPSIGLHQRDNQRLLDALKTLRDDGNTILVVEHDKEMMLQADYVIDIGPLAGRKGGNIVFAGTPEELLKQHTLTADYLNGTRSIEVPAKRREGNGKTLRLTGCRGNNLKDVAVAFPLGIFICVTGVTAGSHAAFQCCHLYWRVHRHPQSVRQPAGIQDSRL